MRKINCSVYLLILFAFLFIQKIASAQTPVDQDVKATDFSIPIAPAFVLLNADPSMVTKPGVVWDVKVDTGNSITNCNESSSDNQRTYNGGGTSVLFPH